MSDANKIGISLSFCVRDIIEGKVQIEDVKEIVAGCRCEDNRDFYSLLERYAENYWYDNPGFGKNVAIQLWEDNKIIMPRLINNDHYPMLCDRNGNLRHWVDSIDEIIWSDNMIHRI